MVSRVERVCVCVWGEDNLTELLMDMSSSIVNGGSEISNTMTRDRLTRASSNTASKKFSLKKARENVSRKHWQRSMKSRRRW